MVFGKRFARERRIVERCEACILFANDLLDRRSRTALAEFAAVAGFVKARSLDGVILR
jgi:hypothetical protein